MRRIVGDTVDTFGPLGRAVNTGAPIAVVVPPYRGPQNSGPLMYSLAQAGRPNWLLSPRTVITSCLYTTGLTAHTITLLRPKNWARIATAVAKNSTAVVLADDPGVYSTNYKYPCPIATGTAVVADNAIDANDFVVYQLTDGTWVADTVASGTYDALVLTTGTPNVTGGGINKDTPLFFFGIPTDVDPATGTADADTLTVASTTRVQMFDESVSGFGCSLHPGDPLLLYSDNGTNDGSFEGIAGYYSKF